MAQVSRGIGWSQESNLLWQILNQLSKLTSIIFGLKPKYKVYTALLTQSGDSSILDKVQGDSLDVGVTYTIASNTENADLTVFGAPNSNVGTSFVCTTAGILPSIGNISLIYDRGAPVVTVLENTIGNIWFTYNGVGDYRIINSDILFTENKTYVTVNSQSRNMLENPASIYSVFCDNVINIRLQTLLPDKFSNDVLKNTPIEIRVYS